LFRSWVPAGPPPEHAATDAEALSPNPEHAQHPQPSKDTSSSHSSSPHGKPAGPTRNTSPSSSQPTKPPTRSPPWRPTPRDSTGPCPHSTAPHNDRSEEHTSELQSRENLVCRLLLEKKNTPTRTQ